jgi:midasin
MSETETIATPYKNKFVDIWGYTPRIKMAIQHRFNTMFRGATGTGKTYLIKELAREYGKTMLVINMTSGVGVEEIKGRYVVYPNEDGKPTVKWIDGVLVTAMKKGYWLVIEEANFMPEELASVLYSVMDDRKNIILDEHENEEVKAHEDFRIFLTANWGYKGTVIPNDAIRNRIDVYFDLTYLPENEEAKLITRETELDFNIAKLISKFAWNQRKIKSRHQPDISTRILIRWATLVKDGMHPIDAGEHTIVALLFHEEKEKDKIRETLKFQFEGLTFDDKVGEKSETPKKKKESVSTKKGTINVGDLVSTIRDGKTYFGIVERIMSSREGDKIWAYFNDNKDDALRKVASPLFPLVSAEKVSNVTLVKTAGDL